MIHDNSKTFFYPSSFYIRFLNKLMRHGKRERIENIVFKVFLKIARYSKVPNFFIFFEILEKQKIYLSFRRDIKKKHVNLIPYSLSRFKQYWNSVSLLAKTIKLYERKVSIYEKILSCFSMYYDRNQRLFLWGISEKKRIYDVAITNRFLKHYRWR